MKVIRFGTFETNSSSAHSLILANKSDFEKFQNHDMVLQIGAFGVPKSYRSSLNQDGKLISWEEARDLYVAYVKEHKGNKCTDWMFRDHLQPIDASIKEPDDLTVEMFKKHVLYNNGFSNVIFGDFKTYESWKMGYDGEESSWSENKDGMIEMETNWRNG